MSCNEIISYDTYQGGKSSILVWVTSIFRFNRLYDLLCDLACTAALRLPAPRFCFAKPPRPVNFLTPVRQNLKTNPHNNLPPLALATGDADHRLAAGVC